MQRRSSQSKIFYQFDEIHNQKHWISFSDLYPCIQNDPLQIYMKYYLNIPISKKNTYPNDYEKKKWFMKQKSFYFISDRFSFSKYQLFEKEIFLNTHSAFFSIPIFNERYKIKIMCDVLVKKHVFPQFKEYSFLDDEKYIPVLCIESKILNDYKKYKALCLSKVLKKIKNIQCEYIFFLNIHTNECQYIDIQKYNHFYILLKRYCKWIRNVQNFGYIYTLDPPSHPFLYPNMKIICDTEEANQWKERYAKKLNEMTLLWKCHPKQREYAHSSDIYSFLDPSFHTDLLNIYDENSFLIQKMIELYIHPSQKIYIQDQNYFRQEFEKYEHSFFIDFEKYNDIIYWIGVGHYHNDTNKYEYKIFVANHLSKSEEYTIMHSFCEYLNSFQNSIVFYWYAEPIFWKQAQQNIECHTNNWIDLCHVFRTLPILVKNCFNFKLKNIAKNMKLFGMIDIECPNVCKNGEDSLEFARQYYIHKNKEVYQYLYDYNYFDCRVLFEIFSFLLNKREI